MEYRPKLEAAKMKVDFKAVKSFLIKELQAELIYLFGSYAKGKLLYAEDKKQKQEFEMLTLKKYARLNEERKEIIQKMAENN
jgi:predicted nucleotidyltransferase